MARTPEILGKFLLRLIIAIREYFLFAIVFLKYKKNLSCQDFIKHFVLIPHAQSSLLVLFYGVQC